MQPNKISRMCQAKISIGLHTVLVWTLLGSLTFGFCSIWSLHFVATLAYELDILVGINVPLTILSSVLAVVFTFAALGSDLLWDAYSRERWRKKGNGRRRKMPGDTKRQRGGGPNIEVRPLLDHSDEAEEISPDLRNPELASSESRMDGVELDETIPMNDDDQVKNTAERESPQKMLTLPVNESSTNTFFQNSAPVEDLENPDSAESTTGLTDSGEHSVSGRSSSLLGSNSSSTFGLSSIMNIAYRSTAPAKNIFIWTGETLYRGCTRKNIAKGFLWSLAITTMHYAGLGALNIPSGYCTLNYALVVLSGIISWFVCIVGCILMSHMETHLDQQILFSITATTGVAAMHFTGEPS